MKYLIGKKELDNLTIYFVASFVGLDSKITKLETILTQKMEILDTKIELVDRKLKEIESKLAGK